MRVQKLIDKRCYSAILTGNFNGNDWDKCDFVLGLGNISILPLERNTMVCNTEYRTIPQYRVCNIIALLHKLNN